MADQEAFVFVDGLLRQPDLPDAVRKAVSNVVAHVHLGKDRKGRDRINMVPSVVHMLWSNAVGEDVVVTSCAFYSKGEKRSNTIVMSLRQCCVRKPFNQAEETCLAKLLEGRLIEGQLTINLTGVFTDDRLRKAAMGAIRDSAARLICSEVTEEPREDDDILVLNFSCNDEAARIVSALSSEPSYNESAASSRLSVMPPWPTASSRLSVMPPWPTASSRLSVMPPWPTASSRLSVGNRGASTQRRSANYAHSTPVRNPGVRKVQINDPNRWMRAIEANTNQPRSSKYAPKSHTPRPKLVHPNMKHGLPSVDARRGGGDSTPEPA